MKTLEQFVIRVRFFHIRFNAAFIPVVFLLLQACSETSTTKETEESGVPGEGLPVADLCDANAVVSGFSPVTALVSTSAPDFTSGAHAVIFGDSNGQFLSSNNLNPTESDISIATHGDYFYRIGRFSGGNNIAKYAINNPQTVIWQYSVNDTLNDPVPANPYDIIFVSEVKAYVLRYGKDKVWIVNPSATTEEEFKIGELDLSAYDLVDGIPEMAVALIADEKFYVAMQRLERPAGFKVTSNGYVAVFDINTDQEIDVNILGDNLKGIPLTVHNPRVMNYLPVNNTLYVQGSGSLDPANPLYTGGIEAINLSDYSKTIILDDGDEVSHPYGLIYAFAMVSPERLYFVAYQSYEINTLFVMDIANGTRSFVSVPQLLEGQIESLTVDPNGLLWVADNANATVRILNPASCEEIDAVSTHLNPSKIVFAQ